MPSDSPAEGDESLLADAIAKISEYISRLEGMSLEDALKDYLGAVSGLQGEKLDALLARLGWHGRLPVTLQAAAEKIGVSRERIRQIEASVLKRLPSHSVVMPPLDKAIDLLENNAPIDTMTFEKLMVDRGISRGPFHPRSVLEAAKLSGRTVGIKVTKARGQDRFITTGATDSSTKVISLAYRQAGASGVSNVLEVTAELESLGVKESAESVREILSTYSDVQFLDEDWFWHPSGVTDRNRLRNVSRKMLSVASPIEVTELREGVRRFFKYRRSRGLGTWTLLVAPRAILEAFYRIHPEFTADSGLIAHNLPLDYRTELSPSEQVMVSVLRSLPTGLLDRASFEKGCLDRGVTRETFSVFSSYSPFIEHLGTDIWTLRGIKPNPAAVEALRKANAERPREKRLLNYGWTSDGFLWLGVRLPIAGGGVVGIPSVLRHTLANRDFEAQDQSGTRCGTIRVDQDGVSWGYGPFLRRIGADADDVLLVTFDLVSGTAVLELTDDENLEQLDPQ